MKYVSRSNDLNDRPTLIKGHTEWTTSIAICIKTDIQAFCFLAVMKNYLNTKFFSLDVQEKVLLKAQLSAFSFQ